MSHMTKRILVGAVLIAAAVAVFYADWRLERGASADGQRPIANGQSAVDNRRGPEADGGSSFNRKSAIENRQLTGLPLTVLIGLLIVGGHMELSRLSAKAGSPVLPIVGMLASVAIGTMPFWRRWLPPAGGESLATAALGLALLGLFIEQFIRHRTAHAMRHVGASLLGVCYLGVCGAVALSCRLHYGLGALVLFLLVVKSTDIGAYFTGSFFGRHKIAPWLSPGKSWEGLAGGLALAAAVAAAYAGLAGAGLPPGLRSPMAAPRAILFGVVIGVFGQVADMCESAMKRDAGAKDSGGSIPAFGGVLDVLDSPLLSAPAAYVLLAILA